MKEMFVPFEIGLLPGDLCLVEIGSEWADCFLSEKDLLANALGAAVMDIQHIGGTAIPGTMAKPILDIAVAISDFEEGHHLVPILEDLGYEYRGENGIPRRHYFSRGFPKRTHHLHMLEQSSADWARHIRFRDKLLAFPKLAKHYSKIKLKSLAEASGNRELYQALKSSFIVKTQC